MDVERIIYHGSEAIVEKPEYGKGNPHNDYGLGFYCCSRKELAKEWAAKRTGHGYVNRYRIRDDRLRILDLTKPPYDDVLPWIALLLHHRELSENLKRSYPRELKLLEERYLPDVTDFDVVIGYRADDAYFRFPEAFLRSEITLESLWEVFQAADLGKQYVLISPRAFRLVRFVDYEEAYEISQEDYYRRKRHADKVFADLLDADRYRKGVRLRDWVIDNE